MEYILFVVYLILFAWLVTKVKFYTRSGLSKPLLIILFLLKIIAGILYGWIGVYYGGLAQMSDTWNYHAGALSEYDLLLHQPKEYLFNLFRNPYENGFSKFFDSTDSYWSDLKGNIFIKILSVFDIISFGNYYVNVIFYSFITLCGPVALYRVATTIFPDKKNIILISSFLLPSFLYWTSGLHKEGLIFTGIGLVVYVIYFCAREKRINLRRILGFIAGIFVVLLLRNFIIVLLVPALLVWITALKWPRFTLRIFSLSYIFYAILFFSLRYLDPKLNFPQAVVNKQQEFISLASGSSTIPITELKPTVISFIKNTPQAITLSVVRPYPNDVHHLLSLLSAIEINVLLLLFLLFLFLRIPLKKPKPTMYFFLFFSFSMLLAIGFSNNNLGAIVRYRSIILPLLVVPLATQIKWERINLIKLLNIKKNNNFK